MQKGIFSFSYHYSICFIFINLHKKESEIILIGGVPANSILSVWLIGENGIPYFSDFSFAKPAAPDTIKSDTEAFETFVAPNIERYLAGKPMYSEGELIALKKLKAQQISESEIEAEIMVTAGGVSVTDSLTKTVVQKTGLTEQELADEIEETTPADDDCKAGSITCNPLDNTPLEEYEKQVEDGFKDIVKVSEIPTKPRGEWSGEGTEKFFATTETRKWPLGFKSEEAWEEYRQEAKKKIGILEDKLALELSVIAGIQGSAATGVSSKTGKWVEKPGDFDIVLINDNLFGIVMNRAEKLANEGKLLKDKTITEQIGYVQNFKKRGVALLHDTRLLPELAKRDLSGKQMQRGIKINLLVSKEISEATQRYMIRIIE